MNDITIYGLHRPDRDIFYVGKSKEPRRRLREHRKRFGRQVEMIILEVVDLADWRTAEHAWIQKFRGPGLTMANRTDGGDGIEVMSAEQRAEISRRQTGRKHTPEARAKMSAKGKGKRKTYTLDGLARAKETRFKPGSNLWATFSPEQTEQHKQRMRDFNNALPTEVRVASAIKRLENPAEMERMKTLINVRWAKATPEERSAAGRKRASTQTAEQRRNAALALWDKINALPPAEREQLLKERGAKIREGRRANQSVYNNEEPQP